MNPGDTAWVFMSIALVFLMTPGLAFFYGGLASTRDALNTMKMCFCALALISVEWALLGYSFSFSGGNILSGGLGFFALKGVGLEPHSDYGQTIPHYSFMMFQMMFAVITPALISGAVVGRMRFRAYMIFISIWAVFVYNPICHWVWGPGGWIEELGALDFAGGTVVHINAGVSALVAAKMVGPRPLSEQESPHNVPFVILGASLLWFGWMGFNGGSSLAADGIGGLALVTTNLSAAAAVLVWFALELLTKQKTTAVGASIAAVIGLVGITPSAGFVSPISAMAIGAITSWVCYISLMLIVKTSIDDTLDVFACHGVGGIIGALLTGVFASVAVNPGGADGILFGSWELMKAQAISVIVTIIYSAIATAIIMYLMKSMMEIRADTDVGMDLTEHGEAAYDFNPKH